MGTAGNFPARGLTARAVGSTDSLRQGNQAARSPPAQVSPPMRLSWFSPAPQRRRRGGNARRRKSAPLTAPRLERRRVFDASIQTMPAAPTADGPLTVGEGTPVTAGATSSGPMPYTFDWSLTKGMSTIQVGS